MWKDESINLNKFWTTLDDAMAFRYTALKQLALAIIHPFELPQNCTWVITIRFSPGRFREEL